MITVKVDKATSKLASSFRGLSKDQIAKATSIAINKTILKGRTVARTAVKKVYNIPQKNLSGISIRRAKPTFLQGAILASSKPIPMDAFSPRFQIVSGGKVSGVQTITRRGITKVQSAKRLKQQVGVSIEIKKGDRTIVPYAFLLPNSQPRVFARGMYKGGSGSYGFIQRHTRELNPSGNDAVKPLISVTVFGAVINPHVKRSIADQVEKDYERNILTALRYQASNAL
jgi:hypothetical protein